MNYISLTILLTVLLVSQAQVRSLSASGYEAKNNPAFSETGEIAAVSLNADGNKMASGCSFGHIRVFKNNNKFSFQVPKGFLDASSSLSNVAMSSNGEKIVTAEESGNIHIYTNIKQNLVKIQTIQGTDQISSLGMKPDGTKFAVGLQTGQIHFYELQNSQFIKVFTHSIDSPVRSIAVTDAYSLILVGLFNNKAILYEIKPTQLILKTEITDATDSITSVDISNDLFIAIGGLDLMVRIYQYDLEASTINQLNSIPPFSNAIESIVISKKSKTLFVAQGTNVHILKINGVTWSEIDVLTGPTATISEIALSDTEEVLVVGSQDRKIYQYYKCISNKCDVCLISERGQCEQCSSGFILKNGACKCQVVTQTLSQTTNQCVSCINPHCLRCDSADLCEICQTGFKKQGSICKCQSPCQTCQQGSPKKCSSCSSGLWLQSSTCVKCDKMNELKSAGRCLKCHPDCAMCTGATENDCKTCSQGKYKSQKSSKCQKCSSRCLSCRVVAEFCTSCRSPKRLVGGSCR